MERAWPVQALVGKPVPMAGGEGWQTCGREEMGQGHEESAGLVEQKGFGFLHETGALGRFSAHECHGLSSLLRKFLKQLCWKKNEEVRTH